MKKILTAGMLMLACVLGFSSCSDDNDLPDVDILVNFEGASQTDGVLYVVQGETFEISSLTPVNNESSKAVELGAASYYWDYQYLGSSIVKPFSFEITVSPDTPVGRHVLDIGCSVYAVDKAPAKALMSYQVQVVGSPDDIPAGGNAADNATPQMTVLDE